MNINSDLTNMRRLLLVGFGPEKITAKAIEKLSSQHIVPTGWVAREGCHKLIKDAFPGTLLFESPFVKYRQNEIISAIKIDIDLLEKLNAKLSNILYLLDRDLQYVKRNHLQDSLNIYELSLYALYILEQTQAEFVVFSDVPHKTLSYILYIICKYKNINTFVINNSFLPFAYIYVSDFEVGNEILFEQFKNVKNEVRREDISLEANKYLDTLVKTYKEGQPDYMKKQFQNRSSVLKRIYNFNFSNIFKVDLKRSISNNIQKVKLKEYYQSICTKEIDTSTPYIFLALHYQPERTSMPQGDIYAQQWLMVKMITDYLPKGWKLYVKEHPSMFMIGPDPVRGTEFYQAVQLCSNVSFVDLGIDTFKLIEKSRAVVTITGTVGLEALVRKKPVLTFGYAPYNGLKGVYHIKNSEDCKKAISEIDNSEGIDEATLLRYIYALENAPNSFIKKGYYELEGRKFFVLSGEPQAEILQKIIDNHILQ